MCIPCWVSLSRTLSRFPAVRCPIASVIHPINHLRTRSCGPANGHRFNVYHVLSYRCSELVVLGTGRLNRYRYRYRYWSKKYRYTGRYTGRYWNRSESWPFFCYNVRYWYICMYNLVLCLYMTCIVVTYVKISNICWVWRLVKEVIILTVGW